MKCNIESKAGESFKVLGPDDVLNGKEYFRALYDNSCNSYMPEGYNHLRYQPLEVKFGFEKGIKTKNQHWYDEHTLKQYEFIRILSTCNKLNVGDVLYYFDTKKFELKEVKVTYVCSDIDGTVDEYEWKLYVLIPFTQGDYSLCTTNTFSDDRTLDIEFDTSGHYKMVLTATDDYGDSASHEKEFDISIGAGNCEGTASIENKIFFIFKEVC